MKKSFFGMFLMLILCAASLAHADTNYSVYWMDNPSSPQLAFKLHQRGEGSGEWYGSGKYQGWKGSSLSFYGPLYLVMMNPQGTASMVFHATSMDRSVKDWIGSIMLYDQKGTVSTHNAWIK